MFDDIPKKNSPRPSAPSPEKSAGYTTAHISQTTIEVLAHRLERLTLACQALWEILRDRHGMSEDELKMKILEVDLRDGTTDGKMATEITSCPACSNKTNSKRATCLVCGALLPKRHVFEV